MARIPKKDVDLILDLISRFPKGASVEEILLGLKTAISRRTLQYRLASLCKQGYLEAVGPAKKRLYRLPTTTSSSKSQKDVIPMSPIGKSILSEVTRPIQERRHVSFNREFLDEYQPNVTYYLPEQVRLELFEMGKTEGNRPAGTYARQIYNRLLIDLSWNSSRLEGNTYSLLETEKLLELGEEAQGKDRRETQMLLNHKSAIEFLIDSAQNSKIDRYTILNIHALLSDELLPDRACGSLRSIPVSIGGSVYLPLGVPQLISECFQQIVDIANAITNPFEQAFFLMVHLPYLQPFEDVNKRVSRLAANIPLIRENLSPLSFVDVPEKIYISGLIGVYELNRIELLREVFVWAYERSCSRYSAVRQSLGEPDPFRIRYRALRKETVFLIVHQGLDKKRAGELIRQQAKTHVPEKDQLRFIEILETELMNLHEGNISRYGLRHSDYEKWTQHWK
jgi:Fic family protein